MNETQLALKSYREARIAEHEAEIAKMEKEAKWIKYFTKWRVREIDRLHKNFNPTSFDDFMSSTYGPNWSNL